MKGKLVIAASIVALLVVGGLMVKASGSLVESEAAKAAEEQTEQAVYVDVDSMSEDAASFSTSLPIVVIDTDGQEITEDSTVRVAFDVIDGAQSSSDDAAGDAASTSTENTLYDPATTACYADIHIRGHSSAALSKKSYRITLYEDEDSENEYDTKLLGMSSESDWVLYGPYLDMTLMRNVLMYGIARQTMAYAPDTRYCELWIDGQYQGVYVAVEKPKVCENRINLATYSLITGESSFFVAHEISGSGELEFDSYTNSLGLLYQVWDMEYPKSTKILDSEKTWIEDYIDSFERALYSDYYLDDTRGYKSYIDLDSFATYYVLNEFSMNEDVGYHSTYCYRSVGGKLYMGPVWDFNSAFNNYVSGEMSPEGFYISSNCWFDKMCTDPEFVDAVVAKYRELRQGVLSDDSLEADMQGYRAELGDAITRNDAVWAHYGADSGLSGDRDYESYDEAYDQLETCMLERAHWLDENIDDLYLLCATSTAGGE